MFDCPINGETKLYGIIGNPVKHSFSPVMQTTAFQAIGMNAVYLPFEIQPNDLPQLLSSFSILNIVGFNITVPYKEAIIPFLDEISPQAEKLGSVNTVLKTTKGWKGYSTDGIGFIRSLEAISFELEKKKALLIGAGGSAKAIAIALAESKVSSITIINRTRKKAEDIANSINQWYPQIKVEINPSKITEHHLLINSTSVGMDGKHCPVEKEVIHSVQLVADIIYNPPLTPLLQLAINSGIPYLNGLGMLLYQGVEAFEIWTGKTAPISTMQEVLENQISNLNK